MKFPGLLFVDMIEAHKNKIKAATIFALAQIDSLISGSKQNV